MERGDDEEDTTGRSRNDTADSVRRQGPADCAGGHFSTSDAAGARSSSSSSSAAQLQGLPVPRPPPGPPPQRRSSNVLRAAKTCPLDKRDPGVGHRSGFGAAFRRASTAAGRMFRPMLGASKIGGSPSSSSSNASSSQSRTSVTDPEHEVAVAEQAAVASADAASGCQSSASTERIAAASWIEAA